MKTTQPNLPADQTDSSSDASRNIYIVTLLLGSISSFVFWYFIQTILADPYVLVQNISSVQNNLLLILVSFMLLLGHFILSMILIEDKKIRLGHILVLAAGPLLTYPTGFLFAIIGSLVLLITLLISDRTGRHDLKNHVHPMLMHIFLYRITFLVTIYIVIISLFLFQSGSEQVETIDLNLPRKLVEESFTLATPLIIDRINSQTKDIVIEETLTQLDEQLPLLADLPDKDKRMLLEGEFSSEMRNQFIEQGFSEEEVDELSQNLKRSLEVTMDANEKNAVDRVLTEVKDQTAEALSSLVQRYQHLAPWFIAITSFLTLATFSFLFRFAAVTIASLWLHLFVRTGWVKIETYQAEGTKFTIR